MNITGGSVSSSTSYLGYSAGSSGTVTVSSGSLTLPYPNTLYTGYSGAGVLNITGGSVSDGGGYLGFNAGSSGTVTVSSGSWNNIGSLYVGYSGTGVFNMTGGSVIGDGYVGYLAGSSGTATVSGGSWASNGNLSVGDFGTGVLNLTGTSIVTVNGSLTLGASSGSSGILNLGTGGVAGTLSGTVTGGSGTAIVNFNQTGNYIFAPLLTGSLTVNKLGAGTTFLTGANSYTGPTTITAGQLIAANASALSPTYGGVVTVAAGAGFGYAAVADAPLGLHSTLAIAGGAGAVLNGSIGSTATSAEINVNGAASATGNVQVNVFGINGVTALSGTNTYTLLAGGAGSTINGATYSLGTVYNNTNFTVGSLTAMATTLQVGITGATALTNAYWVGGFSGATNVWAASNGSTASNWATTPGGAVQALVPGAGANVIFSATAPATAPVATALGANMSIGGLTIADTVNGLGLNADGFALTVGAGGITMNSGVPASTIATNVVLGSSQTWTNNSANALTISGAVSGANSLIVAGTGTLALTGTVSGAISLTLAGTGTLVLTGTNSYTGGTIISAGTLQIGSGGTAGSITGKVTDNGNLTFDRSDAVTFSGNISGTGGLTQAGTGVLTLSGGNTYTGPTIVSAGTLAAGVASTAFGVNSAVILANANGVGLNITGFNTQIGSLTGGGSLGGNVTLGSATLTVGGDDGSPAAYAGVISGAGALTKIGAGTLTLSGANTYTGATTVNGGTLAMSFGSVSANILPSASPLTLGSGTLSLTGMGTQTLNGLTTTANSGNGILLGANETLTLGALTSAGSGSALDFNTIAGGANATTSTVGTGVIVLTGQTAGNAINSGFTVTDAGGFGLATVNASNQIIRLTTTALLPVSGSASATNYLINNNAGGSSAAGSSNLAITASESASSITVDTTAASGVVTLNSGVVLSNNTWNFGGNGSNTWQITGSASGAGLKAVASGNTINFNNYNPSAVTISAPILDNGGSSVSVYGTGTLIFGGANTYTVNTFVSGGTLQIPTGGSINTSSASLYIGDNTGDNGTLNIIGGSVSDSSGYVGFGTGSRGTVTMSSGTWANRSTYIGYTGTGVLNLTGGTLSDTFVGFVGGYGGSPNGSGTATVSGGTWTISGGLYVGSSGTGVLNITGGNVISLSGYLGQNAGDRGTATVSSGAWTDTGALYVGSNGIGVLNLTGTGTVTVGANGTGSLNLAANYGSNGTLNLGTGGVAGTLAAASVIAGGGNSGGVGTAVVNFNQTGSYSFAPVLAGPLKVNKLGAGTTVLTGSNAYTGATTISAGQLIVTNFGALNPVGGGAVTVAAGAGFGYAAVADAPLGLHSTLAITGGAGTVIGGAIGSTATSAEINVAGAASATGAVQVNVYGISGVTPLAGTNTFTLLAGGAGSTLNGATYSLGTVYNNSNFTIGPLTATATTLQVGITGATALTNAYWVGGFSGATNVWAASNGSTASNWATTPGGAVQALVPGAGANVIFSATAPATAPVATALGANMSIGGLTIADTVNGLGLNADGFALTVGAGGITMNSGVPASTIATNVVLGSSQTWTNNSANALAVSGVVSGSAASALTKSGTGTVILTGANTYTGATTINAGTLTAGVASVGGVSGALGNNSAVTLANAAGATLNLAGFNTQIGSLTGGGALGGNVTLGSATLTVGGDNTSPAAYAGVLSGAGGALTKIGAGTLTLMGANTYTGGTNVNGGTLALSFGTVSTNILPSASALTLGGGTLALSGTGTQSVNGLTTAANSAGTGSQILLGTNETLTLGALTSAGANSLLNFNTAAGGANASSTTIGTGVVVLTGQASGNPINYGFTVNDAGGFGLATVNGSNQVVRLLSTLLPASGAVSASDYLINNNAGGSAAAGSSSLAVTASQLAKSIAVDTTAASGVVTLNSGVVLSNNNWSFGGNGSNTWQITGSASGAGLKALAAGNTINFINNNPGAVTIGAPILDNGATPVSVYGTGTLILSGANTYYGNTMISGGTLQFPTGGSLNTNNSTLYASLFAGYNSGDNGTLNVAGGIVSVSVGYLGYNAGSTGTATVSSGSWTTNDELYVGNSGAGTLNVTGGSVSNYRVYLGNNAGSSGTATISSGTWNSGYDLYVGYSGTGVLNIAGGNPSSTYGEIGYNPGSSGTATVSGGIWTCYQIFAGDAGTGVLNVTGGQISNGYTYVGSAAGATGTVTMSGGTWTSSGGFTVGNVGTGAFTLTGGSISNTSTDTLGAAAGSSGTVTVGGSGSWTSGNALYIGYSGTGVLNVTGGSISDTSGNLGLNAGSSGTATVSSGTWSNGSAGLYVGSSGTGVLNITGNGIVTVGGTGTGTATLASASGSSGTLNLGTGGIAGTLQASTVTGGSGTAVVNFNHTGSYTFAPNLTGSLSVNQLGSGTTVLTGTNTYTGATSVSGGTLAVNGSIASSSGVSVAQGATLSGHGSVSVISGAGLVAPGDPEILTATQVDPSGGLSFAFSFTQAGSPTYGNASASGNDVINLTGATPFVFTLTAANIVTVDFSGATLLPGQTYLGGFFTDAAVSNAMENQATFDYTGTNGASVQYEGLVTEPSAAFATGTVTNGKVMEFQVTPEPGSAALLVIGAGAVLGWRRRRATV